MTCIDLLYRLSPDFRSRVKSSFRPPLLASVSRFTLHCHKLRNGSGCSTLLHTQFSSFIILLTHYSPIAQGGAQAGLESSSGWLRPTQTYNTLIQLQLTVIYLSFRNSQVCSGLETEMGLMWAVHAVEYMGLLAVQGSLTKSLHPRPATPTTPTSCSIFLRRPLDCQYHETMPRL